VWLSDIAAAKKNDLSRMERTISFRREYEDMRAIDRLERRLAVARARVARLTTKPGASPA
jgi:hypothetical protein